MSKPDYETELKAALKANVADIPKLLAAGDSNLMGKIAGFAERFGYEIGQVLIEVKNNPMFAAWFAVSPSRQNIYEVIAAKHIEKLLNVRDFRKLGTGELSVLQGSVRSRKDLVKDGGRTNAKTIDFEWKTGDKTIYVSHKYTRDEGGAQDNQYHDLQQFIREARDSTREDAVFIAIADGPYYEGRRITDLKNLANGRNTFAITIDELDKLLEQFT